MKSWTHDPQTFLPQPLKLRRGISFTNTAGTIQASIPDRLPATIIEPWQYRLMLCLDGSQPFVEHVKQVKSKHGDAFDADDVWTFLYWLLENKLVENLPAEVEAEALFAEDQPAGARAWMSVPLQILAISVICLCTAFASYFCTPMVVAYLGIETANDPMSQIAMEADQIRAHRMPEFAKTTEMEVTASADEVTDPHAALRSQLLDMRREMVACQIRRDEYYLQNDENGYADEVARISELAREIGEINATINE